MIISNKLIWNVVDGITTATFNENYKLQVKQTGKAEFTYSILEYDTDKLVDRGIAISANSAKNRSEFQLQSYL